MINKLHLAMIELYRGDAKRIQHFCKVHSYAKLIAETENVDKECLFIIEAAALTHDIGIHFCEEKYGNCNGKLQEKEGPAIAEKMLKELGFDQDVSERVQYLIAHHHTYNNIDEIDYLSELTTNMMSDCSSMESMLSSTIPPLIANGITVTLTCILLLLIGMRMVKVQWSFQSHLTASETHSKGGA